MNFVFISPQFPYEYWNFCDRLRRNGVNVLGVGDTPYDNISNELKEVLTEYYWVPSLEDYDEVFRAVAYLSWKHGKIDWIESNNEHWLSLDARLRDDFNVKTGASAEQVLCWQSKADMKPLYKQAHVPTARQIRLSFDQNSSGETASEETFLGQVPPHAQTRGADWEQAALEFARQVGWPLFAKPERGVGSGGVTKLEDEEQLHLFCAQVHSEPYVLEEFITGDICSWDAILDSRGNVLFENQEEFPPSMADVVKYKLDVVYLSKPTVDPQLSALGRATAKAFGLKSRFVHMEFFRLTKAKAGLGKKGDYVGLEVNVRPPGGFTPEMMNIAHHTDVYQIWADMVTTDKRHVLESDDQAYCVYAGRRDGVAYTHEHDELCKRYYHELIMVERIPDVLSDDLGNQSYVVRLKTPQAVATFKKYATTRQST